jgi:hypothetical protein
MGAFDVVTWVVICAVFCILVLGSIFILCRYSFAVPWKQAAGAVTVGMLLILVDMYLVEPNWIKVDDVVLRDTRLAAILKDTTIVQISDLHARSHFGFREELLVRKINELKPELVLITGDFISGRSGIPTALEICGRIKAGGKFGVTGNNDHSYFKPHEMAKVFPATGVEILRNESRRIQLRNGNILTLAGVNDPVTGNDRFSKAMQGVAPDEPVILLAHDQSLLPGAAAAGVDLLLAGHTHGGQVRIPGLVTWFKNFKPEVFLSGLASRGNTLMYVNRGIGMTTVPLRFLCRPEITVFHFIK